MNYQRIHNQFIADRRAKESELIASGVYVERHHVLPKSLGGGNEPENLIALTAGDHFFAHELLARVHGGHMWLPLIRMAKMPPQTSFSGVSRERFAYHIARRKHAEFLSRKLKGKRMGGVIWTAEYREKWSEYQKQNNPMRHETYRKRVSDSLKGHDVSQETRDKIRDKATGRRHTEEARKRISEALSGKPLEHTRKPVRRLDTGQVFGRIMDVVDAGLVPHRYAIGRAIKAGKPINGIFWEYVS